MQEIRTVVIPNGDWVKDAGEYTPENGYAVIALYDFNKCKLAIPISELRKYTTDAVGKGLRG